MTPDDETNDFKDALLADGANPEDVELIPDWYYEPSPEDRRLD